MKDEPREKTARLPISLTDLEKRLALCARYHVTCYRDGILSLDLARMEKPKPPEFPLIPE